MPITSLPLEQLLTSTCPKDFSARRQLSDVSTCIAKAKKVIVVSGAGISCSSGIPDFRSEDGLYALVKARYPDQFFSGKDLFSSGLFANPSTTAIFYTFIAELTAACIKAQPTRTHHFIHKLEKTGKLLRSYTQNVDGLERRLGMESGGRGKGLDKRRTRNVELHGDLGRVRCTLCFEDYAAKENWTCMFREGESPDCPKCHERSESRQRRAARATAVGTLRPSIVLYDEPHPLGDDIADLQTHDLSKRPDVLLIMGTSLKVHGLKQLVKSFAKSIHTPDGRGKKGTVIFVNATKPSKEWESVIDVHIEGTTDRWVERVEEEWKHIRPADWEIQTTLETEAGLPRASRTDKPAEKPKAKRAAKPVALDKPAVFEGGLPTPRPSASPSLSPSCTPVKDVPQPSAARSAGGSSPLTPLSPQNIQLSPSKRRAHSPVPPQLESPSKKRASPVKLAGEGTAPPATGVPATPGRGNLFGTPRDTNTIQAQPPTPDSLEDEDVFGSPVKPQRASARVAKAPGKPLRRARSQLLGGGEKENVSGETTSIGAKRTAAPALRATRSVMVEIRGRQ